VLGDMLELGPSGPEMHAALAEAIEDNGIEQVFTAGPLMQNLWSRLPSALRGAHAATSAELTPLLLPRLQAGDAIVVKGSLGSRMGPLVKAIRDRFPPVEKETIDV
jgi:UDP-N-acetylmuramoyl-tripeptide--D-alanyl-D-alanine ligase